MNNDMQDLKFTTAGDFIKMSDEGPFKFLFDADIVNVVRREIVTYRVKNGTMIKEEAYRDYYENGDYHDSQNTIVLAER
tara:strand:+ start:3400 stop:3636 length:237 start_codon:yes stop_codon:yes gene_type:complete